MYRSLVQLVLAIVSPVMFGWFADVASARPDNSGVGYALYDTGNYGGLNPAGFGTLPDATLELNYAW